ncbi:hypothetical protein A2982_01165 [candidate division WWE3 bacterium RIFCSPLOWO2_01_FULL_39_13]|uniref:HTH luxR-type domain-containing protein n=1 Tax=candidate division WWE3 bacterium RIFCSPLOWO2_01_FULL_39_13 TaxID=1802624 RepID=A0A1F4V2Q4_UNCKA|nr:MAG: hypothetical protein A2982_01165 [candidate division WWE3 bacterium RIFCSPLOWO2_01_FULL_39_13]
MTEEHDVIRAQKDIRHFEKIYEKYYDRIFHFLRSRVNNDEFTAEDLASSTFEKAIKNIKSFRWQGISFSAWLFQIAYNTLIDFYRSAGRKKISPLPDGDIPDFKDQIEDLNLIADSNTRIKSAINKLNKREQKILHMKFYEGYTNKRIAKLIKLSETNVSTIIYRTMKKLRPLLSAEGYTDG